MLRKAEYFMDDGFLTGAPSPAINVLLIEDVLSEKMMTRIALDAANVPYALKALTRGSEVLPYLRDTSHALPDIILLDLGLPDMDGFAVLTALSESNPNIRAIPIVILTGYKDFDYIRKQYSLPIVAYINKPCDPAQMQQVLLNAKLHTS